jgi:hypothetical protein
MYIYTGFCILSFLWKQIEEKIDAHVCWVLYSQFFQQYTCTSMFFCFCFQRILRIQNTVYMYIYVFFFLFPENIEKTKPTIHVQLCFFDVRVYCVLYSQYSLETELRKHRCKSILGSVFSVFSGNRKKKT